MVRLEIGLDTYSEKYCPSKGEQIALNTDGQQVSNSNLNLLTLTGSKIVFVGFFWKIINVASNSYIVASPFR